MFSKYLKDLGREEQKLKGHENKIIMESLQGIKFIKSYNLENIFYSRLKKLMKKFVLVKYKSNTIKLLPNLDRSFFVYFLIF